MQAWYLVREFVSKWNERKCTGKRDTREHVLEATVAMALVLAVSVLDASEEREADVVATLEILPALVLVA